MDFSELVPHRGSIRGYKNAPVEDEKLQAVLEAARLAPTAHNNQPFRLIVVMGAKQGFGLPHQHTGELAAVGFRVLPLRRSGHQVPVIGYIGEHLFGAVVLQTVAQMQVLGLLNQAGGLLHVAVCQSTPCAKQQSIAVGSAWAARGGRLVGCCRGLVCQCRGRAAGSGARRSCRISP